MIRRARARRCNCCGKPATRRKLDRVTRRMLDLCDRCPSPEEIRAGAEAIQAGWDPLTRQGRELGCNRQCVEQRLSVDYRKPVEVAWE